MLRGVVGRLEQEQGVPSAGVRLFSNSRLPEKPLLIATGLAAYGRNGCAIVPGLGSLFVIAGAVLPLPTRLSAPATPLPQPCGSCRACQAACPVGALGRPYVVDRDRCLQAVATSPREMSEGVMDAWGVRLYGCQSCQSVCPHNRGLSCTAPPAVGEVGAGIPLLSFLSEDAPARAARFRGSALGMSWVPAEALVRNALVAAGNRGDICARSAVEAWLRNEHSPLIATAARWARARL